MTDCTSATLRFSRTMHHADGMRGHNSLNSCITTDAPWAPSAKHWLEKSLKKKCDTSHACRVVLTSTVRTPFPYHASMQDLNEQEDTALFETQWPQAQPIVHHYIMGLIGRRGAIDEIVQDVAFICLRRIATFDKSRSFTAWALGVARLEVFTHRRQQVLLSLEHFPELEVTLSNAEEHLADLNDLRQKALTLCLERLGEQYRKFINLRYNDNQSHDEMAEYLHMSISAVKVTLTRIRAQLRECVEHRLTGTGAP